VIKLYQFPTAFGLLNISPFCMKLECFLRLAKLDYQIVNMTNPRQGPKGKGPYIEDGDVRMGDSSLIIDDLQDSKRMRDATFGPSGDRKAVV